eukprot:6238-Pelagococcus_subviridis.AAC.2
MSSSSTLEVLTSSVARVVPARSRSACKTPNASRSLPRVTSHRGDSGMKNVALRGAERRRGAMGLVSS